MIGKRFKVARAASGLSLRALAAEMDNYVSAQALGKYERNEDMPRSGALLRLAQALDVSVDYLLNEDDLELEDVDFRKHPKTSAREEAMIEGQTLHFLENYLEVEDLLHLSSIDWDRPKGTPYPVCDMRDAEDAARSVRDVWGLGDDPIPKLSELLEEHGVKVVSLPLENIDGLAAKVKRRSNHSARVIVVDKSAWSERKRFTLAHELGHMVIRPHGSLSHDDVEKAANRFAGAFLMPAEIMRAELGVNRSSMSLGELVGIKRRFGVSLQAIAYRCKDLGILNQSAFGKLFGIFSKRGWRKPPYEEPESIDPSAEEPRRFERLCFRALAEGLIGESKAAELLETSVRELNERLDALGT